MSTRQKGSQLNIVPELMLQAELAAHLASCPRTLLPANRHKELILQQENEKFLDQRTDFRSILCHDLEATNST